MPPSTTNVEAVMNDESSLARNATAAAISSGSPKRPSGHVHQPALCAHGVLREQLLEQRRVHRPRTERVDPDALPGELDSELARHRQDPTLGGAVGDLRGGGTHHRDERGGVDDRPLALLEHVRQRRLAAVVDRGQVDLLHPSPGIDPGLEDRPVLGRRDPGVVERDVDAAVGAVRLLEEVLHRRSVGHVHLDEEPVHLLGGELAPRWCPGRRRPPWRPRRRAVVRPRSRCRSRRR